MKAWRCCRWGGSPRRPFRLKGLRYLQDHHYGSGHHHQTSVGIIISISSSSPSSPSRCSSGLWVISIPRRTGTQSRHQSHHDPTRPCCPSLPLWKISGKLLQYSNSVLLSKFANFWQNLTKRSKIDPVAHVKTIKYLNNDYGGNVNIYMVWMDDGFDKDDEDDDREV